MAAPRGYAASLGVLVDVDSKAATSQLKLFDQQMKGSAKSADQATKSFDKQNKQLSMLPRSLKDADAGYKKMYGSIGDVDKAYKDMGASLQVVQKQVTVTTKDVDKHSESLKDAGKNVGVFNRNMLNLKNVVSLIKWPALIAGASYAAKAVSVLAAGATALVGALSPLAGLLAAYPALLTTAGQAMLTFKLAGIDAVTKSLGGLNEKLDKTADEYKQLTPEGQKFARTLNQMKQPIQDLQARLQKPLFRGFTMGLNEAKKSLPELSNVLHATAVQFGELAKQAGTFLGRKGFGRDLEMIGKQNAQLLGRMGDAGLNFADALRHVMVAARPLMDFLGKAVVKFSEYVKQSAKAGRESGDLFRFFRETKDLLKVLGPMVGDLGKGLWNLIRAGKPLGDDIFKTLAASAKEFRQWTESASGENAIAKWFREAKGPLYETGKLIRDISEAFLGLGDSKRLEDLIHTLRVDMLPALVKLLKAGEQFGPVFIDFATNFLKALTPFLSASGPLVMLTDGLGKMLGLFNKLIEAVPELGTVLSTLVGGAAISKLFGGVGLLGGKGGMMGMLGSMLGLGGQGLFGKGGGILGLGEKAGAEAAAGAGTSLISRAKGIGTKFLSATGLTKLGGKMAGTKFGSSLLGSVKSIMGSGIGRIGAIGWGIGMADQVIKGFEDRANESSDKLGARLTGFKERSLGNLEISGGLELPDTVTQALESVPGLGGAVAAVTADSSEADNAEALKKSLRTIQSQQRGITKEQAETIRGRAQELDLTVQQRKLVQKIIGDARTTQKIDILPEDMAEKGAGQLRKLIRKADEAGQAISRSQVKAWVKSGKISVTEGERILGQIKKVDNEAKHQEHARWVEEGFGFGKAMVQDRKITGGELDKIKGQLALVPDQYQRSAGKATVAWAKEEKKKGNITDKEFDQIKNTVEQQVGKITGAQTKGLDRQVKAHEEAYSSINSVVGEGMTYVHDETEKAIKGLTGEKLAWTVGLPNAVKGTAKAIGKGATQDSQKGATIKEVPGIGTGDKVPAMLEPGEVVWNREAVKHYFGTPSNANEANRNVKRFKQGGEVKKDKGGGTMPAMVAAADKYEAASFPYEWGGGHGDLAWPDIEPVDCSGAVSAVLSAGGLLTGAPMVASMFMNWGQSGPGEVTVYANPEHTFMSLGGKFFGTSGSNPGGGAGWMSDPGAGYRSGFTVRSMGATGTAVGIGGAAPTIKKQEVEGPPGAMLDTAQGSIDKATNAADKYIASKVPEGAFGGGDPGDPVAGLPAALEKYNKQYPGVQYPSSEWQSAYQMPHDAIAALAEWAGAPGETMYQVNLGEGASRPGSWSIDPGGASRGYGLWAITAGVGNDSMINSYGGTKAMWNPVINAQAMSDIWDSSGQGAWYGIGHVTSWDQHYTGSLLEGPVSGGKGKKMKKGGIALVGDSLTNGMNDAVGFPSGWEVHGGDGESPSPWGINKVKDIWDDQDALVFPMGSNGDPGSLKTALGQLRGILDKKGVKPGLALMTLGPGQAKDKMAEKNQIIKGLNRTDAIANWAGISGKYVGGDGIHPKDDSGYRAMQSLVKDAGHKAKEVGKKRRTSDEGGHDVPKPGETKQVKIPNLRKGSPGSFKNIFDYRKYHRYMKKAGHDVELQTGIVEDVIQRINTTTGLDFTDPNTDSGWTNALNDHEENISTYNENASTAAEMMDNGLPGFLGHTDLYWMQEELKEMFHLRNVLLRKYENTQDGLRALQKEFDKINDPKHGILADLIKDIAHIQEKVDHYTTKDEKIRDDLKPYKDIRPTKEIQDEIDKELEKKPKNQDKEKLRKLRTEREKARKRDGLVHDREANTKDLNKWKEKLYLETTAQQGMLEGINTEDSIVGVLTGTDLDNPEGALLEVSSVDKNLLTRIQELQGRSGSISMAQGPPEAFPYGTLGGEIATLQASIMDMTAPEAHDVSDLVLQAVVEGYASGSRQYMGAFAQGGVALVGEEGPEIAALPSGTRVHTAAETKEMMAPNIDVIVYVGNEPVDKRVEVVMQREGQASGLRWRAGNTPLNAAPGNR